MIQNYLAYLKNLQVSEEVYPNDPMNNGPPFYLQTGFSALRVIVTALLARVGYVGGDQPIRSILDLGCGYGRVTRWMRAAFPDAAITVADFDSKAAEFCAATFRATATTEPFGPQRYDLIFLGSVFTHMPPAGIVDIFEKLAAALSHNGILVFTTQGRFAAIRSAADPGSRITRAIEPGVLEATLKRFHATGFGFVANKKTPDYGSAWISPQWFFTQFGANPNLVQIMFQEKGWDNFQDTYAYIRAHIEEIARSRL